MEKAEVKRIIKEYLSVLRRNGDDHFPPTDADIDHSALLERLLNGKKALLESPPLAFSYPNYRLVDEGSSLVLDAYQPPDDRTAIILNQHRWNILEEIPDKDSPIGKAFIVSWMNQQPRYHLHWAKGSHEIKTCEGTPGVWRDENRDGWLLERIEQNG